MEDFTGVIYGAVKLFRSQRGVLQAILMLGGHFHRHFEAWRSFPQRGEDFVEEGIFAAHFEVWKSFHSHFKVWKIIAQSKGHFHSKWRISLGVAMGLRNHFAAKGSFAAHFEAWSIFVTF